MTPRLMFRLRTASAFHFRSSILPLALCAQIASGSLGGDRVVVYVDQAAAPGGDGTSWTRAYNDLQSGFERLYQVWSQSTPSESTLKVAQGTYRPDKGTGDRYQRFSMNWYPGSPRSIEMLGGFAGNSGTDPDHRDLERTPTILSGDLQADDGPDFRNRNDNSSMILEVGPGLNPPCSVRIDGIEFYGAAQSDFDTEHFVPGTAVAVSGAQIGGSLPEAGTSITFENCIFRDNYGQNFTGAALRVSGDSVYLRDCTFRGNRVTNGAGGAVAWYSTNPAFFPISIEGCVFEANEARMGGAITVGGGALAIARTTFANNRAAIDGGAIFCDSQLEMHSSLLLANEAGNTGGAIASIGHTAIDLWNCTVAENFASSGGAIQCAYGRLQATNTIFWRNHSDGPSPIIDLWPGFNPFFWPTVLDGVVLDGGLASVRLPAGIAAPLGDTVVVDPAFIRERSPADTASGWRFWNYRLRQNSPAAGAGAITSWAGEISDLDSRPSAWARFARADIGCYFLNTADCEANLNRDANKLVDDSDFTEFVVAYNILISPPANPQADFNRDGVVDDADFAIFLVAYDSLLCP